MVTLAIYLLASVNYDFAMASEYSHFQIHIVVIKMELGSFVILLMAHLQASEILVANQIDINTKFYGSFQALK